MQIDTAWKRAHDNKRPYLICYVNNHLNYKYIKSHTHVERLTAAWIFNAHYLHFELLVRIQFAICTILHLKLFTSNYISIFKHQSVTTTRFQHVIRLGLRKNKFYWIYLLRKKHSFQHFSHLLPNHESHIFFQRIFDNLFLIKIQSNADVWIQVVFNP